MCRTSGGPWLGLLLLGFGASVNPVLNWVWPPVALAVAVWVVILARRQLRSRSRRWLLYPVVAMLAVASIGGGHETVREAADARAFPMPGRLIDVGGHRLHLYCTGTGLRPWCSNLRPARGRVARPHFAHGIVMITFPVVWVVSMWRMASAVASSGNRVSMTGTR